MRRRRSTHIGHRGLADIPVGRPSSLASLGAVVLILMMGAEVPASASPPPPECYEVRLGQWTPRPMAAQRRFFELPNGVRLEGDLGTAGPETGKRLARPPQRLDGRVTWSYWHRASDETLELVYLNDVGSIHLELHIRSWGWVGDAIGKSEPDSILRASASLVSVPCV